MRAGAAADIDVPAGVGPDHADILDDRLGTGVRAAGHPEFHPGRHFFFNIAAVQFQAQLDAVLLAALAERRARADLDAADAIGETHRRLHAELLPDGVDVFGPQPGDHDALRRGQFQGAVVFSGHLGVFFQRFRLHKPAGQVGGDGVGFDSVADFLQIGSLWQHHSFLQWR